MPSLRWWGTVAVCLALVTPTRAQESPTEMTAGELDCQRTMRRRSTSYAVDAGDCLAACARQSTSDPARRCSVFDPDPISARCLADAETAASTPVARGCAGADCPECAAMGDCATHYAGVLDAVRFALAVSVEPVLCDDRDSPDGLTSPETACRDAIVRGASRFMRKAERCFAACGRAMRQRHLDEFACDPGSLGDLDFDLRTQRCVDRARLRLLAACDRCADPPDCHDAGCPELVRRIVQETFVREHLDCQDRERCGDGFVTGSEQCDPGAAPDAGCGPGATCRFDCVCVPSSQGTDDLTTCDPRVTDTWRFDVAAGGAVTVRVDTADVATAADLCLTVQCPGREPLRGDDDVPCSFAPPSFSCPEVHFFSFDAQTCTGAVTTCSTACRDPGTARYRLTVIGTGLALVSDDAP